MTDYSYTNNYTDISETNGLPLGQAWERAAIKDLSDIQNYLTHGLFFSPADYADRLRNSADAIQVPIKEIPEVSPPDWVSPKVVTLVLGIYLNATKIAAEKLGVDLGVLLQYGRARLANQNPEELEQLCREALHVYDESIPTQANASLF